MALSGDGAYLAGKTSHRNTVEVRGTKNGRVVQSFDTDGPFTDYVRFAGSDNLIYGNLGKGRLQVSAVKSGDKVCDLRIGERPEPTGTAVSPGGRLPCRRVGGGCQTRTSRHQDGGRWSARPARPATKNFICKCVGLNFSGDGAEIAGLFESFSDYQIVVWSAATGKMLDQFDLAKTVKQPTFYKDNGLEWFPDRSAWLVLGHAVVDRQSGKKVWNLPYDDKDLKVSPRHFLDNDHAVVVSFGQRHGAPDRRYPPRQDPVGDGNRPRGRQRRRCGPPTAQASRPRIGRPWSPGPPSRDRGPSRPPGPVAEKRLTARPINLKNKGDEARGLLFAGAGSTQVVVFGSAGETELEQQPTPARDSRAGWNGSTWRAVAPSAWSNSRPRRTRSRWHPTRRWFSSASRRQRTDWTCSPRPTPKPVVGWRPYDKESGDQRAVIWAELRRPEAGGDDQHRRPARRLVDPRPQTDLPDRRRLPQRPEPESRPKLGSPGSTARRSASSTPPPAPCLARAGP